MSVLNYVQKQLNKRLWPISSTTRKDQYVPIMKTQLKRISIFLFLIFSFFFSLIITCNSYYKTKVSFPFDSVWVENTFLSCKVGNALLIQNLAILFRYSAQTITPPHPQMHQVHSRYACKAWFLCSFCLQLLIL